MLFLTRALFYIYVAALLGVGASGIFIAEWELAHLYGVPLSQMEPTAQATILNQYRFLKSAELAFGIFAWLSRHDILAGGTARRIFLIGVFIGVGARLFATAVDGMPHWSFLLFAAEELAAGVCVWIYARQRPVMA